MITLDRIQTDAGDTIMWANIKESDKMACLKSSIIIKCIAEKGDSQTMG
jgi:hypothetical protein